jgi:hypothetical protein
MLTAALAVVYDAAEHRAGPRPGCCGPVRGRGRGGSPPGTRLRPPESLQPDQDRGRAGMRGSEGRVEADRLPAGGLGLPSIARFGAGPRPGRSGREAAGDQAPGRPGTRFRRLRNGRPYAACLPRRPEPQPRSTRPPNWAPSRTAAEMAVRVAGCRRCVARNTLSIRPQHLPPQSGRWRGRLAGIRPCISVNLTDIRGSLQPGPGPASISVR